jgi:peroxiredoxin
MNSKPSVILRGLQRRIHQWIPCLRPQGMTLGGFFIIALLPFISFAQGMMPPKSPEKPAAPPSPYLLIGNTLPESLLVTEESGKSRTLLSHKAPIEVLVLGFFSPRCEANQAAWRQLKKLYENYEEWHVAFVAVSVQSDETSAELSEAIKKAGLNYTVVRDDGGKVARALNVTALPEIVIVDEWSQLRYRGPIDKTDRALQNVISHQDPVPEPEPAIEGCALQ